MHKKSNPRVVREAIIVWIASILVTLCAWGLGQIVPWFYVNLGTIVALSFLFLPTWILWRNKIDVSNYGFRLTPLAKGVTLFALVSVTTLPIFAGGFHVWNQMIVGDDVTWSSEQLNQFPQSIQGRPSSFQTKKGLQTWVENERLWVLWTENKPIQIRVKTNPTATEDSVSFHAIHVDKDGVLRQQTHAAPKPLIDQQFSWNNSQAEWCDTGCGFSISIASKDSLSIETEPPVSANLGQWGESSENPFEMDRSWTWAILLFFVQLITVAIPEEWFFRCYLQQRLDEGLGTRWNLLGTQLGWGWIISSFLFALGHLVLDPRIERLAVFFPGLLFGWMFARTRSIVAPALMHALANVNIQALGHMLSN